MTQSFFPALLILGTVGISLLEQEVPPSSVTGTFPPQGHLNHLASHLQFIFWASTYLRKSPLKCPPKSSHSHEASVHSNCFLKTKTATPQLYKPVNHPPRRLASRHA